MSKREKPELQEHYDIVIIGAGMAGSAFAYAVRDTEFSILMLERGEYIPQEQDNWEPDAVIRQGKYEPRERWINEAGERFRPRIYYNVGGSSKFFGGSAFRYRLADFDVKRYPEGETVPWPITYEELSPYYDIAERQMWVHGEAGADPSEPPRGAYPYPPLIDEPPIAKLRKQLEAQGLNPFPLPIAVHQGPQGRCQKGSPCDGFPCKIRAKGDGENAFLRPALREKKDIDLRTLALVTRLIPDESGRRINAVEFSEDGALRRVGGGVVILAAGAANSAALLLASRDERHPEGLANSSGEVGRNFMAHNNTVLMALSPFRRNPTQFQKTFAINDFYLAGEGPPLGNIQMRGKVQPENLGKSPRPLLRLMKRFLSRRTFDFWIMSEDLPSKENRIEVTLEGEIRLSRRLNNLEVHRELVRRFKKHLRRCGFPIIFERTPSPGVIQHQVGTLRFGHDPNSSVLNEECRAHDLENLYVVDGSVFPSSAAVNPALTIAANALRIADLLHKRLSG